MNSGRLFPIGLPGRIARLRFTGMASIIRLIEPRERMIIER